MIYNMIKIDDKLTWKSIDIDIYVTTEEWTNTTVETGIQNAREFYLVGHGTYMTTPILPTAMDVNISNGMGTSDGYNWSGVAGLSLTGTLSIVTSRIGDGAKQDGYLPHFTKLYYR